MQGDKADIFTAEQTEQLRKLKSYFPFRIVWGGINPQNQEFEAHADHTRAKLSNKVRKGWLVATIG